MTPHSSTPRSRLMEPPLFEISLVSWQREKEHVDSHIGSPSFFLEVMHTVSAHLSLVRAKPVLSTKLDVDRTEENKKSGRYLWSILQLTTLSIIIFSFPFLFNCSVMSDSL